MSDFEILIIVLTILLVSVAVNVKKTWLAAKPLWRKP